MKIMKNHEKVFGSPFWSDLETPGNQKGSKNHAFGDKSLFYLPARGRSALAANSYPEPCQTQPFPVFAMAGPTKREWSTPWAAQLLAPRHVRCLWRIRSIALLILGDQAHQQCNVFPCWQQTLKKLHV